MKSETITDFYRNSYIGFLNFMSEQLYFDKNYTKHQILLTNYLEEAASGKAKRLIINAPPEVIDALSSAIAFPDWIIGRNPKKRISCLFASASESSNSLKSSLQLVTSQKYQKIFNGLNFKKNREKLENSYGGFKRYITIDSYTRILDSDLLIVKDPADFYTCRNSEIERNRINHIYDQRISSDLKPDTSVILITSRIHEDDLTSYLLNKGGWENLVLPAIATKNEDWTINLLGHSKRYTRSKGEALEGFSKEYFIKKRHETDAHTYASQYQQFEIKPKYGAIIIPKEYESLDDWKKKDFESYMNEFFLRDSGFLVIREEYTMDELIKEGNILRKSIEELPQF